MTDPQRTAALPASGRARLDSLTALRFFAAFTVVAYHSWSSLTGSLDVGLLHFGYTAVGFFFTLSGLVLGWSWTRTTSARLHWRRRAARIIPLHWLMLGAMVGIYVAWPVVRSAADSKSALLAQAGLLQAWPPYDHLLAFNYPSWSLSTEAFFYLVFPLLMVGLSRLSVRALVRTGISLAVGYVVAAVVLHHLSIPTLTDGNLLALPPLQFAKFAAGAAFGAALGAGWRPRLPAWAAALTVGAVVLALPATTAVTTSWGMLLPTGPLFADLLLAVPMVLLVVTVAGGDLTRWSTEGRVGILGRSRLLVALGESSFALYLVHAPLLYLTYVFAAMRPEVAYRGPVALAAFLAVCLVVAHLLHRFFEKPVERWVRQREPQPRRECAPASSHRVLGPQTSPLPRLLVAHRPPAGTSRARSTPVPSRW